MVTSIKGNATSTFGGNVDVPQIITDAPAFSATMSADQTISNGTWTKVAFNAEDFDTNSNYDHVTNYRFTPTVAGYYQFNSSTGVIDIADTNVSRHAIYKNGSRVKHSSQTYMGNPGYQISTLSTLIYMNGSTDYAEVYFIHAYGSNRDLSSSNEQTFFQAFLARAV